MDFYKLIAHYWGVSRSEAKTRLLEFYCLSYNVTYDNDGNADRVNYVTRTQPEVLNFIDPDARTEVLNYYGFCLGYN